MNFDELKELKVSIDTFDDAAFVSLLNENEAIIQNIKNKSLWSLPFKIEEGLISFYPNKGTLLENADIESEEYSESLSEINKNILIALNESDDEAYQSSLQDLLKFFDPKKSSKSKEVTNEDFLYEGTNYDHLSYEEAQWVKSFQEKWRDKLNEVRDNYLEFQSIGSLFNEENELKDEDTVLSPLYLLNKYQESLILKENFLENSQFITEWNDKVSDIFDSSILEGVNPLSDDWKIVITKNALKYKKDIEDISVNECIKILSKIHEEVFAECDMMEPLSSDFATPAGGGYDGENKLKFLKMSGIYTLRDLEGLIKDFDYVLGSWSNKDQDELQAISAMKDKVEYMYRTNTIDDEMVSSIINSFNMKYGRDGRDIYRNPDMSSGTVIIKKLSPEISQPLAV